MAPGVREVLLEFGKFQYAHQQLLLCRQFAELFPNHGKQKALYVPPCVGQFIQCLAHGILVYAYDSVGLGRNLILPKMSQAHPRFSALNG